MAMTRCFGLMMCKSLSMRRVSRVLSSDGGQAFCAVSSLSDPNTTVRVNLCLMLADCPNDLTDMCRIPTSFSSGTPQNIPSVLSNNSHGGSGLPSTVFAYNA